MDNCNEHKNSFYANNWQYRFNNEIIEETVKVKSNCILNELKIVSKIPKVLKIKNIFEDPKNLGVSNESSALINPCYGDPSDRTVHAGSFMSEKAFLKSDDFYFPDKMEVGFQRAGPRLHIALKPSETVIAILTSGGLCPGSNVVIRELVMSSWYNYGVRKIFGIKWGYEGALNSDDWMELDPCVVKDIHRNGGTILGTSRCELNAKKIVDNLIAKNINVFFVIGGDGTHKGLEAIAQEFKRRNITNVILAAIPKTIDNDIPLIDRSFGFDTAVQQAVNCIQVANVEANSTKNGIGLVRMFGRNCGFIALEASKASRDVNICLIPESPFNLYGEKGLLKFLFKRLSIKNHSVIVVAEGSASALLDYNVDFPLGKDKSGNPLLADIGAILKQEIKEYAKTNDIPITLKYLDPTYTIRGCPANSFDCNYCTMLAQNSIHCIFSGFSEFTIGFINNQAVMIPLDYITSLGLRKIDIETDWDYLSLMASTGQASFK